jgi:hypothetical protein
LGRALLDRLYDVGDRRRYLSNIADSVIAATFVFIFAISSRVTWNAAN